MAHEEPTSDKHESGAGNIANPKDGQGLNGPKGFWMFIIGAIGAALILGFLFT